MSFSLFLLFLFSFLPQGILPFVLFNLLSNLGLIHLPKKLTSLLSQSYVFGKNYKVLQDYRNYIKRVDPLNGSHRSIYIGITTPKCPHSTRTTMFDLQSGSLLKDEIMSM